MPLRNRKRALQLAKGLDAFPKTQNECIEVSSSGGTFSMLTFILMGCLIVWETTYYLDTKFTFKFKPDVSFNEKLIINIDITVAMKCNVVGADVSDVTGEQINSQGALIMEDTWFELDPDQKLHFEGIQRVNTYLREQYHAVHRVLWKSGYVRIFGDMPERRRFPDTEKDACRIHGMLTLNKVAGALHITPGKTIQLSHGHAHLGILLDQEDYSFSHRISKLSFGDHIPGVIHPLEGDEELSQSKSISHQYFITVVPTKINTYNLNGYGYQYSVSCHKKEVDPAKGHGTGGIFFKYDISALQVEVTEEHGSFLGFLTRLVGIIGGVFTCSGIVHSIVGIFADSICCRYFAYKKNDLLQRGDTNQVKTSLLIQEPGIIKTPSLNPSPPSITPVIVTTIK